MIGGRLINGAGRPRPGGHAQRISLPEQLFYQARFADAGFAAEKNDLPFAADVFAERR